jgi:uncharacterized protein (TIGR02271 family)
MTPAGTVAVTGPRDLRGTIDTAAWPLDGSRAQVLVQIEGGAPVFVPLEALVRQEDGSYRLTLDLTALGQRDCSGSGPSEPPLVLPVIQEVLDVETRPVETGRVRLRKVVHEREELVTLTRPEEASVGTLAAYGVPEAEAQPYADAVRRGGTVVLVDTTDDRADRALALMERAPAMDRETRPGADAARERGRAGTREVEAGDINIPVVEETLQVGTRQVQRGGVRIYTRVTERPVEETVRLRDEEVHVERHPVDRPATEADVAAAKEGTIEVTETDEEAVARKQARVVEEVVVSKDVTERTETVRDTVRRTEVEVEPTGPAPARDVRGFDTYEADFRSHYTTSLAGRGHPYERWAPGYRYGYELASDRRYAGRDWSVIEADARRDWEGRHQGTWDEFKDTIRHAWERVRGRG